jgi:hypothetical protein
MTDAQRRAKKLGAIRRPSSGESVGGARNTISTRQLRGLRVLAGRHGRAVSRR